MLLWCELRASRTLGFAKGGSQLITGSLAIVGLIVRHTRQMLCIYVIALFCVQLAASHVRFLFSDWVARRIAPRYKL